MSGAVFIETLRRTWRQTLLWGAGLGLLALVVVLMLPLLDAADIRGLLERLPPMMVQAIGLGDDIEFAVSPEGLIALGFFGKLALIFVVYPVVMGMRVTSNEEADGTLDVLLSLPVPRWRVLVEKFAAYLVTISALTVIIFAGLWLGSLLINVPLNIARLAETSFNLLPTLTFVLAFTVFVGALLSRRQIALAVVTIFVLASFMLDNVASTASESAAAQARFLSFFSHYNAAGVMQYGLSWPTVAGILALSGALLAGAVWLFDRRDVGV